MNAAINRCLKALESHGMKPCRSGKGWTCRCPAHDDRRPSLSIGMGSDGKVLLRCHAGCTYKAIAEAIGLKERDLFEADRKGGPAHGFHPTPSPHHEPIPKEASTDAAHTSDTPPRAFNSAEEAIAHIEASRGRSVATWTYHDRNSVPVGKVLRWNTERGGKIEKTYLPVSRGADGLWRVEGMSKPRPLFDLPGLLSLEAGSRIYVTEGERAADAARAAGLVATTSPHGSQAAGKADWSPLAGLDVVVLPDHDTSGEEYAADVVRLAAAAGAKSVRVVRLAGRWRDLPEHGDVADVVDGTGGDVEELESVRTALEALAEAAAPEDLERYREASEASDDPGEPGAAERGPSDGGRMLPKVRSEDLLRDSPDLRPVVIEGLLRAGETMNVIASPKVGKSWLVLSLVLAVSNGREWLGKATTPGRVLLIDAELHLETIAFRLRKMRAALGFTQEDLVVSSVRGQRWTVEMIEHALRNDTEGGYRLIVLDALYRFLPLDGEENANETMTRVYNTLDAIAMQTGAAIVVVHHATKGDQSSKAVTDVGAGAGAQSRAADTHMILRRHEEYDAVVVDAAVRSFAPMEPFVIRCMNPGWELAPDLDPARLLIPARRTRKSTDAEKPAPEPVRAWTPADFAKEFVGCDLLIREEVIDRAIARGLGKGRSEALLKRAIADQLVHRHRDRLSDPYRLSTDPPSVLPGIADGVVVSPPAPGANAPGGTGGEARPPYPPATKLATKSPTNVRTSRDLRRLVDWIKSKGGEVTVRELVRGPRAYREQPEKAESSLEALMARGLGSWAESCPQGKPRGRPTRLFRLGGDGDTSGDETGYGGDTSGDETGAKHGGRENE